MKELLNKTLYIVCKIFTNHYIWFFSTFYNLSSVYPYSKNYTYYVLKSLKNIFTMPLLGTLAFYNKSHKVTKLSN